MNMTLDFAIQHALEAVHRSDLCEECRSEHQQLADWLQELKEMKGQLADYCKRHWTMHKVRERDYCSYGRRAEMKVSHEHNR